MKHQEDNLQESIVRYFKLAYPKYLIFAVPNGGNRNAREGARFKRQGVLAGVSDLIVVMPNRVLFIELKWGKNKQQSSQKKFQSIIESLEHEYYVVYSIDEFINLMKIITKTKKQ